MQTLIESLGSLSRIDQWFVWRMVWDAEEGKFLKHPCRAAGEPFPMDASLPHNWQPHVQAAINVSVWNTANTDPSIRYTLGFYLTADCGYWFLDMDKALVNGEWSALAAEWMALCPGCFFEVSSSGNGGHIIGRGTVPDHAKRNKEIAAELYTEKRGIAFGTSGQAWGNADVGSAAIASIASQHFPPRPESEAGEFSQPRAEWSGPADDDELIAKALSSPSVAAKMGNKASFADLWNADPDALLRFYGPDGRTETDMALAQHLAFWTGCDAPRIERLMRRSKLARPKWDMHRTYLRELTITNACAQQVDVCKDKRAEKRAALYAMQPLAALPALAPLPQLQALPVAPGVLTVLPVVSPETVALIEGLLDMVNKSATWADMHNTVIPAVRAAGVPAALMPRIENAINKRLELYDAKLPVAKLRSLLATPRAAGAAEDDDTVRPTWIDNYVYVRQNDKYFDIVNGYDISVASFKATHDRDMPVKGDGVLREDSHVWALHKWNVPLVHDTMYDPRAEALIDYDGRRWANLYSASSLPAAMPYTDAGVAAIERFKSHLWLLCGQRERIYENLLSFMAHCVQKPGKLIRWVPIIKGTEGDGKSMITEVMSAAMGRRNVSSFGPEIICNAGGFTDWAHGHAFIALEEMYMTGRERFMIANRLKLFISNNRVNIYPKGAKQKDVINTCCKIAYTNHTDGIPLDDTQDRRWFVIFSPFANRAQLYESIGCTTEPQVRSHFDAIFNSLEREPGQWRAWLQSLPIPDWFSADGAALMTEEKKIMAQSGVDDIESILRNIVEEGAHGVSATVLSSAMLTSALKARAFMEGLEVPKTTSLHHLLNRIGFMKVTRLVRWQNMPHRLWIKPGVNEDNDNLRALLDATTVTSGHGVAPGPVTR